ncbi:hypothetical protein C8256_24370 [Kluyvera genomosp. 2]|uniref:Uncharacterized protein n=1 Tax=Kluyvera genomosp. 2 TaxID=2774054 RepID=A0A2T2XV89_9ENTR|nr:hypothetical protein C8256_24370 [Kluyvera genomosp. 2]
MARNPQGFGGDWRPRSGCLAEWGSTTGTQRGPGAEGGQLPAFASGSGHRCTAAVSESGQEKIKRLCVYLLLKNNKLRINPRH